MYPFKRRGGYSSLLPVQKNAKSGSIPKTWRSLSTPNISARDLVLTANCDTRSCSTSFPLGFSCVKMSTKRRQSSENKCFFPGECLSSLQSRVWFLSPIMRTGDETPAGNAAEEMPKSSGCHELQHQCLPSLAGVRVQGQHLHPPESCRKSCRARDVLLRQNVSKAGLLEGTAGK